MIAEQMTKQDVEKLFRRGAPVVLMGNHSPVMVVEGHAKDDQKAIRCIWHLADGTLERAEFHIDTLMPVPVAASRLFQSDHPARGR